MSDKKNRSNKKPSEKDASDENTGEPITPDKLPNDARYEGYDQERSSVDPARQSDYDVDENDIRERSDEYKNYGGGSSEDSSRQT